MNPVQALTEAAESGATVTVEFVSGLTVTGNLGDHPTVPGLYVLRTGGRGRPRVVHPMDVEDVTFE